MGVLHEAPLDLSFSHITFSEEGDIIISEQLDAAHRVSTKVHEEMKIDVRVGNNEYLRWHREKVFHS